MRIEERDEQPYRSVSRFGPDAASKLGELLPPVFEWLEVRGVDPAGTPFFRYHVRDELEVEAGVPVPRGSAIPASDEDVTAGMLPAGRYAVTTVDGDPRATDGLLAWAREQNLEVEGDTWISRPVGENGFELSVRVTG
ncbi:hypothetical protein GCM10009557_41000 [Virgisporangium ochraceum]|uniref:GyrI-like small molecule binding domain-containing protein n=1 Tax=Virgisporangium ochraceum TaxID=65505 RepID=A0A8J4ECV3_9ACTN|nr:GyrI-like domain-containing protein [Virgisporangium ochraceum]GIJ70076.1 hypothetical protein Voc01_049930 [Virgisporangium ochraceum]